MAKSTQGILYGVKDPNARSLDGSILAVNWAGYRAPNAWGDMTAGNSKVIWFNDPNIRDEFYTIFGGMKVILARKEERTFQGHDAADLLRRASAI